MVRLHELVEKGLRSMRTGISVVVACCALVLASGCGSSATTSATSTSAAAGTTTNATTSTNAATKTSTSAAKPTSTTKSTGSAPEIVKVDTTPKFASPSPSAPVQSGTVQIAYRDIAIEPDTVRVKLGATIKWTNYDPTQANVTSEGGPYKFASKNFGEGGTFELKVEKPGVIHYESTQYPVTMNGTIEVVS
jgi:plastocyanin